MTTPIDPDRPNSLPPGTLRPGIDPDPTLTAAHTGTGDTRPVAPTTAGPDRSGSGEPAGDPVREIAGYEIHHELGSGAMGVVYQARQVKLNRIVALKMRYHRGRYRARRRKARP